MKKHWIITNIIAACVFILLLTLLAQIILKGVTRHNKEIEVPDFSSMSVAEATKTARHNNIKVEVTDSVYTDRLARGAVFSQNPKAGSSVKRGRRVMLTINAIIPKTVKMPDVVGYSLRQAMTELFSKGLTVGRLSYEPDIATNNVLSQRFKGSVIRPGRELEVNSPIDLVLGCDDESVAYVPLLKGFSLNVAKNNIWENSLNVGTIRYDETVQTYQDTLNAVVYRQDPLPEGEESACPMGSKVNIYLTTSQQKISAN